MMKHVFDENGITYRMYDNSFFEISDIEMAQKPADQFDSKSLCRQLDLFAHKVNPYLDTIENILHQGYYWCVDQCEYATDVFSFPGRKLNNKFQGEAVSDYRKRPEGWRIKFKMKSNSIKMYDKFSSLRIEMTINDPKEFKVFKDVEHRDGTSSKNWVSMGKSISNLYRYAGISKAANNRFLSAMQNIVPVKSTEAEINEVCSRKTVRKKTVTGFNVWAEDTFLAV